MEPLQQRLHSAASRFASGSEFKLIDDPCCAAAWGEADGERNNGRPLPRAAATDTDTDAQKNDWSRARAWTSPPLRPRPLPPPPPPDPSHVPWCPGTGRRHLQRRPPKHQIGCEPPWRSRAGRWICIGQPHPTSSTTRIMATASTSGQSTFGLGRKKKNPGLMDQISKFFGGGDKKKRSKVSIWVIYFELLCPAGSFYQTSKNFILNSGGFSTDTKCVRMNLSEICRKWLGRLKYFQFM